MANVAAVLLYHWARRVDDCWPGSLVRQTTDGEIQIVFEGAVVAVWPSIRHAVEGHAPAALTQNPPAAPAVASSESGSVPA